MPARKAPLEPAACRVVLVGPENPLNVGFAARAMKAFGAEELVVAASAWTAVPAEAHVTGKAAPELLAKARLVPTLAESLRGCGSAIAFSRRPTVLRQEEIVLPDVPPALARGRGTVALVFGRESAGLTREESALCPYLARIPDRAGVSLNLGQAVAVALFSLTAAPASGAAPARREAALDRLLGMWDFLEPRLAAAPRFTVQRLQRVRQMLYGLRLDDEDFDLLFGVMNELARPAAARRMDRTPKP